MKKEYSWKTKDGKVIKATINVTREIYGQEAYLDGDKHTMPAEVITDQKIDITLAGKTIITNGYLVELYECEPKYDDLKAAGVVGQISVIGGGTNLYLLAPAYEAIKAIVTELMAAEATPEMADIDTKVDAAKKVAAKMAENELQDEIKAAANGLCPRCGTYCYGDCR